MKAVKQTLDERCNESIEEIYKIAIKLIIETISDGYGEDDPNSNSNAPDKPADGSAGSGSEQGGNGGDDSLNNSHPPSSHSERNPNSGESNPSSAREGAPSGKQKLYLANNLAAVELNSIAAIGCKRQEGEELKKSGEAVAAGDVRANDWQNWFNKVNELLECRQEATFNISGSRSIEKRVDAFSKRGAMFVLKELLSILSKEYSSSSRKAAGGTLRAKPTNRAGETKEELASRKEAGGWHEMDAGLGSKSDDDESCGRRLASAAEEELNQRNGGAPVQCGSPMEQRSEKLIYKPTEVSSVGVETETEIELFGKENEALFTKFNVDKLDASNGETHSKGKARCPFSKGASPLLDRVTTAGKRSNNLSTSTRNRVVHKLKACQLERAQLSKADGGQSSCTKQSLCMTTNISR